MNSQSELDPRVASAFYGRFTELHPTQLAAIAPLLEGKNVILSSGTGSGKTEAVVAPLISKFWREFVSSDRLFLLYISPTKALANDLVKRLEPPCTQLGLRVGLRHGDRDDLVRGAVPHVLITTPESLEVLLIRKDAALLGLKAVVVDEVHLLYNTQRGLQLSILLRRLQAHIQVDLQWVALSATIGSLEGVSTFLFGKADEPVYIQAAAIRTIDAHVRHVESASAFLDLFRRITAKPRKVLVFANSRHECEELVEIMQQDDRMRDCVFPHYSSLSPEVREATEAAFASQGSAVCVATSTLELGIDIGDIDVVLLWGPPPSVQSFLQRIGRSNRRSSKTNVVCLVPFTSQTVVEDAARFLVLIHAGRKGEIPRAGPHALFGAAAQQYLSAIHSAGEWYIRTADLCAITNHHPHLDRDSSEAILAELAHNGYIQAHGYKNRYAPDEKLYSLVDYRMIYGNFAAGSKEVPVRHRSLTLAFVPATNLLRISRGSKVRLNGQCWMVRKSSLDGFDVEPTSPSTSTSDFTYGGGGTPPDMFVTNRVWHLYHTSPIDSSLVESGLYERIRAKQDRIRESTRLDQIPFEHVASGYRYLTYGGRLVNKAIALFIRSSTYKADDVELVVDRPIDWKSLPTDPSDYEQVFPSLFEVTSEQSLFQSLLPLDLQLREFLQGWLESDAVKDILLRLVKSEAVEVALSRIA